MSQQAKYSDHTGTKVLFVLLGAAILIIGVWLLWLRHVAAVVRERLLTQSVVAPTATSDFLAQLGQAGDAFGSLNALFGGLAASLVAAAAYLQNEQLRQARVAYHEERGERLRQQFESTFFQMLGLARELVGRVNEMRVVSKAEAENNAEFTRRRGEPAPLPEASPQLTGEAALDAMADRLVLNMNELQSTSEETTAKLLATLYERSIYKLQQAALGPYFRLLFQIFKIVDESSLDPSSKIQYANIVRGQLSEGAAFLLGLNGLTARGHRFIPYIEKYGLLEHSNVEFSVRLRHALRTGYRERAFHGSKERAGMQFEPRPLRDALFFTGDAAAVDLVASRVV